MEKEEFVDKLFIALQRLSSGAQKRVLEDMRRLNSSILCKEHRVYDVNKEKPIARYGRPICEMLLRKLSKSKCVPLEDDINWSITKGKRKNYIEVRRALKHLMVFAASYYLETKDKEFMECFLNTLNSNQDSLVKSTAPIMYKSITPEIIQHYREDHSAKDFNRPEFKKLLAFAKKNKGTIDYLLVTTWDRFSRNVTDSFVMIRQLKNIGIEVQAIEQPIDFTIPESKAMLAINLVFPEIDNDRRSIKIRGGIRGSLKAGRWCRRAPMGYQNKRDGQNKPIMIPSDKAPFIQYAFDAIEKGKNQSLIRQELLKKGYKISRNNMSLLLRNPIYIGKIILPAYENEKETLVEGIHESIISERQFYNVQNILQNRRRKQKKTIYNSLREELPLRGKLHCSKCDSKMTGSPSRSSNGTQYFYYHCNHCKKERYNAHLVNNTFESILNDFVFTKNSKTLYKELMQSLLINDDTETLKRIQKLKNNKQQLDTRIEKLQDLLVDGTIDSEAYSKTYSRYTTQKEDIVSELEGLKMSNTTFKKQFDVAFDALDNFKQTYTESRIEDKSILISSIFPESLQFDGKKCRTPRINDVLRYILQIDKDLPKNKTGQISSNLSLSRLVVPPGIEPGTHGFSVHCSTN